MSKNVKITKDMTLAFILEKVPESHEIFAIYGLHCASCMFNEAETLEMGALGHGMSSEDVDEMVEEINRLALTKKDNGSD